MRLPANARAIFGAMAIYLAAVLVANATATTFIPLTLPFEHYPLISVGTLVFGITFTQRDRVHGAGRAWVYAMLLATAAAATVQSMVTGVPMATFSKKWADMCSGMRMQPWLAG